MKKLSSFQKLTIRQLANLAANARNCMRKTSNSHNSEVWEGKFEAYKFSAKVTYWACINS